ncbi:substrate-binding domain-containing protein [Inquilinus sp. NPDC058860]|uniref:substrate-binding domain-containing protein n=1 Tax=Inquilinus sp. NPDC058860 TaxID=3346652 RepID=UPI0036CDF20D
MKRLSHLGLAALAAGGLLAAAPASAETIYGGGSTAAFGLYRSWFDCYGRVFDPNAWPRNALCTAAAGYPVDGTALFAYAPVGSYAGIQALIRQTSATSVPSSTPYETASIPYAEGTTGYGTGPNFWDFSGSTTPLTGAEAGGYTNPTTGALAARGPAIQIPSAGIPVTIPVNTTGLTISRADPAGGASGVYLSRKAYCGIFTGYITNWNDPVLTQDNNGVQYHANRRITVVRSNGNGMTYLLSRHLTTVCNGGFDGDGSNTNHTGAALGNLAYWKGGAAPAVTWPTTGTFVSAAGDAGVARTVSQTLGAIGYVSPDFTRMIANPVPLEDPVTHASVPNPQVAVLQNYSRFISATHTGSQPSVANTAAALAGFVLPPWGPIPPRPTFPPYYNTELWSRSLDTAALRNPMAAGAYPIVGFTILDFYACYFPAAETATLKGLVSWYTGHHPTVSAAVPDQIARNRGLVPLPQTVKDGVWAFVNDATLGLKTGPIPGTCTISSGT